MVVKGILLNTKEFLNLIREIFPTSCVSCIEYLTKTSGDLYELETALLERVCTRDDLGIKRLISLFQKCLPINVSEHYFLLIIAYTVRK